MYISRDSHSDFLLMLSKVVKDSCPSKVGRVPALQHVKILGTGDRTVATTFAVSLNTAGQHRTLQDTVEHHGTPQDTSGYHGTAGRK